MTLVGWPLTESQERRHLFFSEVQRNYANTLPSKRGHSNMRCAATGGGSKGMVFLAGDEVKYFPVLCLFVLVQSSLMEELWARVYFK